MRFILENWHCAGRKEWNDRRKTTCLLSPCIPSSFTEGKLHYVGDKDVSLFDEVIEIVKKVV